MTTAATTDPDRARQLEAVLDAALNVLGARCDRMLGLDEWTALARTVAACQGQKTASYLTEDDLYAIAAREVAWSEATDGPVPRLEE